MKKSIFVFYLLMVAYGLFAQRVNYGKYGIDEKGHIPKGLEIGVPAPDFKTTDTAGNTIHLQEILKTGPVVLIFYRGAWCPVCIRYLSNLQDSLHYLTEKNATLLAVTPEVAESIEKMRDYSGATFTIISDQHEQLMRDYDVWYDVTNFYQTKVKIGRLTNIASNNDEESARLPVPATYVIDRNGLIVYCHFDLDYHKRASVRDMLRSLPPD